MRAKKAAISLFIIVSALGGLQSLLAEESQREKLLRDRAFAAFDAILAGSKQSDLPGNLLKLPHLAGSKYVIFSDLHIGDNSKADNFSKNEDLVKSTLIGYFKFGFSLILLGDVEELHQFDLRDILLKYFRKDDENSLYSIFEKFFDAGRLYRIYGNHDFEWSMAEPISKKGFGAAHEAILVGDNIILTHGHQAMETYEEDVTTVRVGTGMYRWLEKVIRFADDSDSILYMPELKDRIYSEWACQNDKILICGHTHNPIINGMGMDYLLSFRIPLARKELKYPGMNRAQRKQKKKDLNYLIRKRKTLLRYLEKGKIAKIEEIKCPLYVNPGGCIYYDGITGVEIEGDYIRLMKWDIKNFQRDVLIEKKITLSNH